MTTTKRPPELAGTTERKANTMDARDELATNTTGQNLRSEAARVLIVGGSPSDRDGLAERLRGDGHTCVIARSPEDARRALAHDGFDLLLLGLESAGDDPLDLATTTGRTTPHTKTIVFSPANSFRTATEAMRCGAVDFICTTGSLTDLSERIRNALVKSREEAQRGQREQRLREICAELDRARTKISDEVDTLCTDLGSAYQDLSEHLDDVAVASEFRTLARLDLDVEDLLRTTLEFLLAKIGPTNAAVFLPETGGQYNLGAYVNYDCPRESIDDLLDPLCDAVCPQLAEEEDFIAFEDAEAFARWLDLDRGFIAESQVLAFSCRHEGECLAVIVLFRHRSTPFLRDIAVTLDTIRVIFANQLARIIGIHHRGKSEWPDDLHEGESEWDDDWGWAA